jgi:hypothetical protein
MNKILEKNIKLMMTLFPVFVPYLRSIYTYWYNKKSFLLKKSSSVFTDIYERNYRDSQKSKSGSGSTLEATVSIREHLPLVITKYSINSMLDAPCGDYIWMKEVQKNCHYLEGDIVTEVVENNQKMYSTDKKPFCLPQPIMRIKEKSKVEGVECDKTMYLYDLKSILYF